ncbi:hypothetical protein, partial [Salmonella sp. s54836]|uniref:hypothetical protein n=1 Tax=Salmonella sp. s54836 TaxID=3159673 RepID=UPI00397FC7AE
MNNMMQIHKSWRANKLLKGFSSEQIEDIKLKCAAYSALYGQKSDWGLHCKWSGDDAATGLNPKLTAKYKSSVSNILKKLGDET